MTPSLFTMEHVTTISTMGLPEARHFVKDIIDNDLHAKPVTKLKATRQIVNARSTVDMAMSMTNWLLAHPTEGLKALR